MATRDKTAKPPEAMSAEEIAAAEEAKIEADEAAADELEAGMTTMTEAKVTPEEAQEAGYYGSVSKASERQQAEASIQGQAAKNEGK